MGLTRVRCGGAPSLNLSISQLAELNLINDTNSGMKHSVTGGSVKGKDTSSAFPDWYDATTHALFVLSKFVSSSLCKCVRLSLW